MHKRSFVPFPDRCAVDGDYEHWLPKLDPALP